MKKCKIGIIGAGGIANGIHLPVLSELADAEIAAVCDISRERAETAAKKFDIPKTYSLYHQMLQSENIDSVFVLTDCSESLRTVYMRESMYLWKNRWELRPFRRTACVRLRLKAKKS